MQIRPLYVTINSNIKHCKQENKKQTNLSFGEHFDLQRLRNHFPKVTESCFFRRGKNFNNPSDEFQQVVDVLKSVFSSEENIKPKKMLIAGVGNSQEPYSYLAIINSQNPKKSLYNIVDMYTVDLQSLPNCRTLFKNSIYNSQEPIKYAKQSFITDNKHNIDKNTPINRVQNSIYYYILRVYNNIRKAKWETPIQNAIKSYDDNFFEVISANNILPYVKLTNGDKVCTNVLNEMYRCIVPGGYLITDPQVYRFTKKSIILEKMNKIADGIYKKI